MRHSVTRSALLCCSLIVVFGASLAIHVAVAPTAHAASFQSGVAAQSRHAQVYCYGSGCNGLNPIAQGCIDDATVVASRAISGGWSWLYKSNACDARWAKTYASDGVSYVWAAVYQQSGSLTYYETGYGSTYTKMIGGTYAYACGRVGSGSTGCTTYMVRDPR